MPPSIHELDCVALRRDLPAHGLRADDVGAVVLVYNDGEAFEVEFVAQSGRTVALLTLYAADVRPIQQAEEMVARAVAPSAA